MSSVRVPTSQDRQDCCLLPAINSVDGATKAMAAITTAVANGELTPTEAAELSRVIDGYIKSIEATEIERRLRLLEERVIPTFAFFSPWGVSSRALNLADPAAWRCSPRSAALPLLYVLGGFVVGCTLGCDLNLPPFPKFGFRSLHAATSSGSICGKALVACVRCGVSVIIGRMQSNMMPRPLLAPLRTKPAWLHAALIRAQGCQLTG
jgi:hypothetical protein